MILIRQRKRWLNSRVLSSILIRFSFRTRRKVRKRESETYLRNLRNRRLLFQRVRNRFHRKGIIFVLQFLNNFPIHSIPFQQRPSNIFRQALFKLLKSSRNLGTLSIFCTQIRLQLSQQFQSNPRSKTFLTKEGLTLKEGPWVISLNIRFQYRAFWWADTIPQCSWEWGSSKEWTASAFSNTSLI